MKTIIQIAGACAALAAQSAVAITSQLIITAPATLAGRYAAVTFTSNPGAALAGEPTALGSIVIYDSVDCEAKTFVKPTQPAVSGPKVALVMDAPRKVCPSFDAIVRTLVPEGLAGVVVAMNGIAATGLTHERDVSGVAVPTLFLNNRGIALDMRAAVVSDRAVAISHFVPAQLTTGAQSVSIKPGQSKRFAINAIPSSGRTLDLSTVDIGPTLAGRQTTGTFLSPEDEKCNGIPIQYVTETKTINVTAPARANVSAQCAVSYLVRDTGGNEVAGVIQLMINLPVANNDVIRTTPGKVAIVDVLGNDFGDDAWKVSSRIDLDVTTEKIDQKVASSQGTWEVVDGKLMFTPGEGFIGTVELRYRIEGPFGGFSNTASVRTTVATDNAVAFQGAGKIAREFYLPERDTYFITSDLAEANAVADGLAGPWVETGNFFGVGGNTQVCRFYGNTNVNTATNAIFGPSSHFFTIDAGECDSLKRAYDAKIKSWKFESNDFFATPAVSTPQGAACPANTIPVYRMYNNGFPTKDSNHRYSSNPNLLIPMLSAGWKYENVAFCVPA